MRRNLLWIKVKEQGKVKQSFLKTTHVALNHKRRPRPGTTTPTTPPNRRDVVTPSPTTKPHNNINPHTFLQKSDSGL
jgi:hypothetical protein